LVFARAADGSRPAHCGEVRLEHGDKAITLAIGREDGARDVELVLERASDHHDAAWPLANRLEPILARTSEVRGGADGTFGADARHEDVRAPTAPALLAQQVHVCVEVAAHPEVVLCGLAARHHLLLTGAAHLQRPMIVGAVFLRWGVNITRGNAGVTRSLRFRGASTGGFGLGLRGSPISF